MTSVRPELMTVGELSRRTGVSIKNLRQYTDWGLIHSVGRSPSGYRLFDAEALWCVGLIGRLRGLGLTVAEIRELAHRRHDPQPVGPLFAKRLRESRERIEDRIAEMQQTLDRLDAYERDHLAELDGRGTFWAGDPRACRECA